MEEQGPFDRILQSEEPQHQDRAARIIVGVTIVLGLVLLILVLPPISIFSDGDRPAVVGLATEREELPPPPPGFVAVSSLLDFSAPGQGTLRVVNLSTSVEDGVALTFFTYQDGEWSKVGDAVAVSGDAVAVADGNAAEGEVPALPANVAVFRPREETRLILGSLPAGAELDERALAVLTTLNPAGFVPAPNGSIAGGVQLPAELPVPVAPTISALAPPEADALNTILASSDLRATHVQAILALARENGFAGIDLDYRAIDPVRRDDFVAFVQELSSGLRGDGLSLSLTIPLPVRQGQDWDLRGFDWEALAPLVDAIKLAPEPDQDRYYQRLEDVLDFLVPTVGASKLILTVGPLSRERSAEGVRTLTLTQALALASTPVLEDEGPVAPEAVVRAAGQNLAEEQGASGLFWDDTARAIVFTYAGLGGARTVWVANVFSEGFKLELAGRHQLGGVVVEDVSRPAGEANIWPAVQQYAQAGEVALAKPNGELLQPQWVASGGTLESDTGPSVTWRAPAEAGTYTLTLIVSDGVLRVGQRLQIAVQPPAGAVSP